MPAVEDQRASLQPGEQVLGKVINHLPPGDRPRGSKHQLDDAVESEEKQTADRNEAKQPEWSRLEVKCVEDRSEWNGQRPLAQHMVGNELHWPGLQSGHGG